MCGAKKRFHKEPAVIAYLYSSTHHITKLDLQATRMMCSHRVAATNGWTNDPHICDPLN